MQYRTNTQKERSREKEGSIYSTGMSYMINEADGTTYTKILNKSQLCVHRVGHILLCYELHFSPIFSSSS